MVKEKCLLVEGKNDQLFFAELINYMGFSDQLEIIQLNGKDNLRGKLGGLMNDPKPPQRFGIVLDADDDPHKTFSSIQKILQKINLPAPTTPVTLSENSNACTTIVMIIPNIQSTGMLEDLCLRALENDPTLACVDVFLACLDEKEIHILNKNIAKLRLNVILATKESGKNDIGVPFERAIKNSGLLDWEHATFDETKKFLNLLLS